MDARKFEGVVAKTLHPLVQPKPRHRGAIEARQRLSGGSVQSNGISCLPDTGGVIASITISAP
jgi:hypothetical protein